MAAQHRRMNPASTPDPVPFRQHLRALALLCECLPYVDDPDYAQQVVELLREAGATLPIDVRCEGGRCEIALRDEMADAP
jgi:hypothetical protein